MGWACEREGAAGSEGGAISEARTDRGKDCTGLIFRPELVEKILTGEKTETRRKVREGEACRYEVGKTYALQPGRGKKAVGRIRITGVRREHLGQMSHHKALREGFTGTGEFLRYWQMLYGPFVPDLVEVWAIRFELVAS